MINHVPPVPSKSDRRKYWFKNRNDHPIKIEYFKFESDIHPRLWDTTESGFTMYAAGKAGDTHSIPIVGTGTIFVRWHDGGARADTFAVVFDHRGEPYPYIFGGDRWTMALRHRALQATAEGS